MIGHHHHHHHQTHYSQLESLRHKVKSVLIQPANGGSAHTSWEQAELPQDTVKKKHQYFIKLLFLSGPDQSLDSHSPTGREDSFVFAPQVEQQSDCVHFWKPLQRSAHPSHSFAAWFLEEEVKGKKEKKSGVCEGENMVQRSWRIALLGLISFTFPPGWTTVRLEVESEQLLSESFTDFTSLSSSASLSLLNIYHLLLFPHS